MTSYVDGTAPYRWPYDGRIGGDHLALVVAGWDEGWAGRSLDPGSVEARCRALADAVARLGGAIVTVAHGPTPLPALTADARLVTVPGLDAFYGSPLDHELRADGRTHLLVAGLGLEGPVHSTLRSANDRGYECLLVTDACAPGDPETGAAAIKTVTMSGGIFGAVGAGDAVLAALAARPTAATDPTTT